MRRFVVYPFALMLIVAIAMLACSSKFPGYDKTESGLYFKLFKVSKDTIKPRIGDYVTLNMRYSYKDSTLFDSKSAMNTPVRFQLPVSDFKGDIYEGIAMLSPGDSADFIVSADSLFMKTFRQPQCPPFIDSNSVLHFYVTLLSVDPPGSLIKKEQAAMAEYLEAKKITATPTESGLYYIETLAGKGAKIDTGSWVKVHFSVSLIDEKPIFSTYDRQEPMEFEYGKKFDTEGFEEGVGKMLKGGKATLIVPSPIAFGEMGRGAMVPPYSTVIYNVEVIDIVSKAEHEKKLAEEKKKAEATMENNKKQESALRTKYLQDKKITAKPTASGLIYVEKVKGTGARAVAGKTVKVHYTGTLLDGTKFDSSRDRNEPFEFSLGQGQVIQGWDEGIAMMNVGGKATLIIPSNIAYGDRNAGSIPPYSTLVFDVELMDVK